MKYTRARIHLGGDGFFHFRVTVDGARATIMAEQPLRRDGLIFLGSDFEETVEVQVLPADPDNGRFDDQEVLGFTADEEMLALYDVYLAIGDSEEGLREGPVRL